MSKAGSRELAQHAELHWVLWRRKEKPISKGEAGDAPAKTGLKRLELGTGMETLDVSRWPVAHLLLNIPWLEV